MEPELVDRFLVITLVLDLVLTIWLVGAFYGIPDLPVSLVF